MFVVAPLLYSSHFFLCFISSLTQQGILIVLTTHTQQQNLLPQMLQRHIQKHQTGPWQTFVEEGKSWKRKWCHFHHQYHNQLFLKKKSQYMSCSIFDFFTQDFQLWKIKETGPLHELWPQHLRFLSYPDITGSGSSQIN